jgi:hypothetical protein
MSHYGVGSTENLNMPTRRKQKKRKQLRTVSLIADRPLCVMSVQWCNWTLSDTNKIYHFTEVLLVAENVQSRHWTLSMQSRQSAVRLTVSSCLTKELSRSIPQQVAPLNLKRQKFSFGKTSVCLLTLSVCAP